MSYANHICRLAELACQAYARSVGLAIAPGSILCGFDDEDKMPTPRVVLNCDNAEPDGHADDAVWAVTLEIQCVSNCDDRTKAGHHEFTGEIFSQFMAGRYRVPDMITSAALSSGVNFFCQDIMPASQLTVIQERKWLSSLVVRVVCSGFGIPEEESTEPPGEQQGVMDEGGGNILDEGGGVVLPA